MIANILLSIYEIGNFIGHWTNIIFVLIMAAGLIFCMKNYVK